MVLGSALLASINATRGSGPLCDVTVDWGARDFGGMPTFFYVPAFAEVPEISLMASAIKLFWSAAMNSTSVHETYS
jgi:hypothetical protein